LVDDSAKTKPTTTTATKTKPKVLDLPDHANIVIVGGGIIGASVAYHLGQLGVPNVVLLERHQLTSGTTWHAAGLMTTFGSLSSTSMAMRRYTKELYRDILPQETGLETGFMDVGFIELAAGHTSQEGLDRLQYFRRVAAFNRLCGVPVEELTPDVIQRDHFPFLDTTGVLAGFHVPCDGRVNPTDATMALAKGARQYGVQIHEGVSVTGITTTSMEERGAGLKTVTGVTVAPTLASSSHTTAAPAFTDTIAATTTSTQKVIQANVVVNCAGMWARQLGELCGVTIPNQAAEHYYLLTDAIDGLDPRAPVLEDPSKCIYLRPEGKGLLIGFFEWDGAPWKAASGIPHEFAFGEIEPDWDRMTPYLELALERLIPELRETVGIKKLFCGPESFTPDGNPIVGPAPHLKNYYVAAGMNSIGILTGGGIGKTLAQWIVNDGLSPTDMDVTGIHINRFHKYQSNPTYRNDRVGESLGDTYRLLYPHHQPKTCRGAKQSPFHERLTVMQATFRDVSGWESPAWYATSSSSTLSSTLPEESFGRCHWFPHWEAEHLACRNNVALFDMSFMSKYLVQGVDAGSFLNRLSTANVNGEIGTITYTQWLNELGYLEADLTVTKLDEDQFLVVATDTMHHHVQAHMTRRLTRNDHVVVTDMTARYAQLNLQGPQSRKVLQQLTSRDMSHDAFPFRHVEDIEMGLARVLCARITYVGELGYELFIPVEQALHVYDQICQVGRDFGLRHAGLRALGSLRMVRCACLDVCGRTTVLVGFRPSSLYNP
jgi:glycine/D-amino acid oxidase-like deaminating enzyme/sarcosine oxidase gamma subunit